MAGFLPPALLLQRQRHAAGTVRHSLDHGEELGVENVSLNNIMAAMNRLGADVQGNKFPAQVMLPPVFYERAMADAHSRSIMPEYLDRDRYGGIEGIIIHCSLYPWEGETVLLHTPHNDTVWELEVGTTHDLIRREAAFKLLGPNKGFDLIVPFNGMALQAGAPIWKCIAPPRILLDWIAEGYESPKAVLDQIAVMAPKEQVLLLQEWHRVGYDDSVKLLTERGLLKPEVAGLLEAASTEA